MTNKAELIDAVAEATETSKAAAGEALDAVIAAITNALKSGEEVRLVGFGTFSVKTRAAGKGRNPPPARKSTFPLRRASVSSPAPSSRRPSTSKARKAGRFRPAVLLAVALHSEILGPAGAERPSDF